MDAASALFGYSLARKNGCRLREISFWSFDHWKEIGMTHVCLSCAPGPIGFRFDSNGKAVGETELDNEYLSNHGEGCAGSTMRNLQSYDHPADWVEKEVHQVSGYMLAYPGKI